MKLRLAVSIAAVLGTLGVADVASAATVGVQPGKKCYRAGEKLAFLGNGYTPNAAVNITSDGEGIGSAATNNVGVFGAELTVGIPSGEKVKTYAATDQVNPAITASVPLRVSAVDVSLNPKSGPPGRRLRIKARGFTTGKRLYAHVRKGRRYKKNIKVGTLKRACKTLKKRKRLISRRAKTGTYKVQFDTKRRYSSKTPVRIRYQVTVFKIVRPASASAASVGERWVRVR